VEQLFLLLSLLLLLLLLLLLCDCSGRDEGSGGLSSLCSLLLKLSLPLELVSGQLIESRCAVEGSPCILHSLGLEQQAGEWDAPAHPFSLPLLRA
jgi:hypothetical protein